MVMNTINKDLKPSTSIGKIIFIYSVLNFCVVSLKNANKILNQILKKLDKIFLMKFMKLAVRKLKKNSV